MLSVFILLTLTSFHDEVMSHYSSSLDSTCQTCSKKFESLFELKLEEAFKNFLPKEKEEGRRVQSITLSDLRPGICESTILYSNGKFYAHNLSRSLLFGGSDNKIYLRHEGFFLSLVMILEDIEKILKVKPPEFLFNFETKDNPTCNYPRQEIQHGAIRPVKGLLHHSFCSPQYCDGIILLPTSYNQRISAMEATRLLDERCSRVKWEKRSNKLFWRGSYAGKRDEYSMFGWKSKDLPRLKAVKLAKFRKDMDIEFGFVPWERFMRNKYILAVAGNTYSSLFKHALRSGSCILRQEERMFEWYEPFVKAWVHYVPLNWDLSDLDSKLNWMKVNDTESKNIAQRARKVGSQLFTPEIMSCYSYCTLKRFRSYLHIDLDDDNFRASFVEIQSVCNSKLKKRKECISLQNYK